MLSLISYKIKIQNTHQREIKNLLLKTDNKRNTTINNSVKKVADTAVRSWIPTILIFFSHTGLGSLNQVFNFFQKSNLRVKQEIVFSMTFEDRFILIAA